MCRLESYCSVLQRATCSCSSTSLPLTFLSQQYLQRGLMTASHDEDVSGRAGFISVRYGIFRAVKEACAGNYLLREVYQADLINTHTRVIPPIFLSGCFKKPKLTNIFLPPAHKQTLYITSLHPSSHTHTHIARSADFSNCRHIAFFFVFVFFFCSRC